MGDVVCNDDVTCMHFPLLSTHSFLLDAYNTSEYNPFVHLQILYASFAMKE
jgi:hypothetical protein